MFYSVDFASAHVATLKGANTTMGLIRGIVRGFLDVNMIGFLGS